MTKNVLAKPANLRSIPLANLPLIHSWFDEAALHPCPYPTDDVCYGFARALQIAVNRSNNTMLEKWNGGEIPIDKMADVSPADIVTRRWTDFRHAAKYLLLQLERLEESFPRHEWGSKGTAGLNEIDAALSLLQVYPSELPPSASGPPGRPHEAWHAVGHAISPVIQTALKGIGFRGRLRKKDFESATSAIGAAAISWAYEIEIQPARLCNRNAPPRS